MAKFVKPKMQVVPGVNSKPDSLLERDVVRGMKPGSVRSAGADAQGIIQIIKLKGALIKMDIKKEKVKVDSSGNPILKNNAPEPDTSYAGGFDTAGKLISPSSFVTNGFVGVMGEIGAGLKFESTQGKFAVSGSLKNTAILSSLDLALEDFAFSTVRGVLLAGPAAKFSDFISFSSSKFTP
jgi:hypothetical protein